MQDSYNCHCGLTGAAPDFDFHCEKYAFDKEIDIENAKLGLNWRLQKGTKGILYPGTVVNLIDPQSGDWSDRIDPNGKKTFKYNGFMKYLSICLIFAPMVYFLFQLIVSNDKFNEYSLFLIGASVLLFFVLKKEFSANNKIEVDRNGLTYNNRLFLWRFIEAMYIREIDNGSESEGEEYLIILLKSGKEFELETLRITFYSKWRFKKILNTYRNITVKSLFDTG